MKTACLGDIVSIKTGKLDANASSEGGPYPFFTCAKEPLRIDQWKYDCDAILIAGNGDLNIKHYAGKFEAYQRTYILSVLDEVAANTRYLYYFLDTYLDRLREQSIGGIIKYIKLDMLKDAIVPLPSLPEQRRIAAILDQADALREKRRKVLAKLDEMAQAIFVEMFVSNEGKHDAWPRCSIGSLAMAMRTGPFGSQLLHSEFVEQGIAVLGIDNAVSNQFAWGERRFITERKYRELSRYRVFPSDVIVTIMGTCGRVAIVPADIPLAITTKHLCSITLDKERCLPEFLHACLLRHPEVLRQLGAAAKGAVMPGLNMGIIKGALIPVPPLLLQAEFVKRITSLADIVAQNNNALSLSDDLFSSLQHRAFSGDL